MCNDAAANKLAMVPLSNNTIKLRIQELSIDILKQFAAAKRSGNLILQLGEITDFGNDAQFIAFMSYGVTKDFAEQNISLLLFTCQTYHKKCFKNVNSFSKEHQLS